MYMYIYAVKEKEQRIKQKRLLKNFDINRDPRIIMISAMELHFVSNPPFFFLLIIVHKFHFCFLLLSKKKQTNIGVTLSFSLSKRVLQCLCITKIVPIVCNEVEQILFDSNENVQNISSPFLKPNPFHFSSFMSNVANLFFFIFVLIFYLVVKI
ncbi:hypothetical protein RFI_05561 [Reticulomyxa filosa]|uniref:Transmembrane protein n=1 Tax=Reticulomyxa filosa TaxID=46433 RepID=X6P0F7_RETFI|nr:hypothetical protein RFI_05561 [Reticulomyxa filosa]|eukprot:ETO31559.1 hypothetical protein RFI_05561 [Reticulomyxa filosa]